METEVLKSWSENASEWIDILTEKKIPSRTYTNAAIIEILEQIPANKILDCGCGEGWLTRYITSIGKQAIGIDGTQELIDHAKSKKIGRFYRMSYDEISTGVHIPESPFNAVVFNFSIYQKEGLAQLFEHIQKSITEDGFVIIQTLHPSFIKQEKLPYESQWIEDSWKGLPGSFSNGHSWYARTFDDWQSLFADSKLELQDRIEVMNNKNSPVSVIFVLKKSI